MFKESEEYKNREFDVPTEVYMRRKELLDDIQRAIDIVEPGWTRRRGKLTSTHGWWIASYLYLTQPRYCLQLYLE
jgi:hypothetical protein